MARDRYIEIEYERLLENPLNCRSMDPVGIMDLAESIRKTGHLDPLTVKDNKNGSYTILSGHRRYAALKALGYGGKIAIPCIVSSRDFEGYEAREEEYMLSENFSRKSQSDIRNEILIASRVWDTLPQQDRDSYREAFREEFQKASEENPSYKADPEKYMANRFRPRIFFIRKKTGTAVSDRMIEKYISEAMKIANEEEIVEEKEEKERKEKKITGKAVLHCAQSLHGLILSWEKQGDAPVSLLGIEASLSDFIKLLSDYE